MNIGECGEHTPALMDSNRKAGNAQLPRISSTGKTVSELSKLKEKYPNIKLFGKTRTCPFCSEQIPIELAQKHYEDKHEGS